MKEYKIKPLLTGFWRSNWGDYVSPLAQGYIADIPIFIFLIEGENGEQIIVDGSFNPDSVVKAIFNPLPRTPDLEVPEVLKANGVNPEAIKTVIITHLHTDHTGYLKLFTHAKFYIQEQELLEAYHPYGVQAVGACTEDWIDLVPKFKLMNGNVEILDGIELILAPGHTPGHQAVAVNTSKGRAIITGDALAFYAGMAKRFPKQLKDLMDKARAAAGGKGLDMSNPEVAKFMGKIFSARFGGYFGPVILNQGENMRSLHMLDEMADIVIPAHDPLLLDMKVIPDDYHLED